jgi:D-alanine-D-alanine ligase
VSRGTGRRIRVAVVYGGRSVEHEVSLVSARAIMQALDKERYEVVPVVIGKSGRWATGKTHSALPPDPSVGGLIALRGGGRAEDRASSRKGRQRREIARRGSRKMRSIDVVFPVVHGTGGEDGSLQGLLELADIPYVGAGVLGSALGMDKALMKAVFRDAGLPIVDYRVFHSRNLPRDEEAVVAAVEEAFGYPCFVKPSNGGSSVGISKAKDGDGLRAGLRLAGRYDRKIVVERGVAAREIECSVLGNDRAEASVPGEIIPVNEFYDYRAKYIDEGSRLVIPAEISEDQARRVRDIAVRAFEALDLAGMARVDFFLDRTTEAIFLNEVNTIPGFTPISMYPKLWEASGLPFSSLVDRLIQLALERHAEKKTLVTSYHPSGNGGRRLDKKRARS